MTLKRCLTGGLCLAAAPILLNVISLPAMAYLIRQLGPVQYGQWIAASAFVASMSILSSLGLRGAFIRQLASSEVDVTEALANQLGIRLVLSLLATTLALLAACLLGYPLTVIACIVICSLAMVLTSLAMTLIDLLQALHRSVSVSLITFISGLSLTLASVTAAFVGGGPMAIAASYCIGPTVLVVLAFRLVRLHCAVRVRFSLRGMKQVLVRSRGFTAQQLLNSLPVHAEAFLLPQIVGFTRFGFYSAGTLLPSRLGVVPDAVCTATYPLLCQRFKESQKQGVRLAIQLSLVVVAGALVVAVAAALGSGLIARLLFPGEPDLCQLVLVLAIWTLPLSALDASIGYALNAAGADEAQARASVPAAMCNVFLIIFLMMTMGVAGACIAMPLRHLVRIIMLGVCCLHLRRSHQSPAPILVSPVTT